jgi:beta-aspartyl-peptidase (threonine type)
MDASIHDWCHLELRAVTVVKDIAHPITLARRVMEKTPHFLLAGEGANRFAKEQGFPTVPAGALVSKYAEEALENFKKCEDNRTEIGEVGTVGAVAIDGKGRLAAATSTGGINGKMVGRSSDTSIVGSGTYADDEVGAVSTTGHGESIARFCLAHAVIYEMRNGSSASAATSKALTGMTQRLHNTAGPLRLRKMESWASILPAGEWRGLIKLKMKCILVLSMGNIPRKRPTEMFFTIKCTSHKICSCTILCNNQN